MTHEFNPDDFAPIPDELLANQEEENVEYSPTEKVVEVSREFLNIEGAEFGAQIFHSLQEGHLDPVTALLMIKKMHHLHDYFLGSDKTRTNPKAKQFLKDEIAKIIGKETYRAYGATISIENTGAGADTYDFKDCGDIYLNKLEEINKKITELIKERKTLIKSLLPVESRQLGIRSEKVEVNSLPVFSIETIETQVCNLIPPTKKGRESLIVRFAKKAKNK
jgi:hypothetical protein